MIGLLVSAVLGQAPMFPKIIPNPTGSNGYEEYVRAADYTTSSDFVGYRNWLDKLRFPSLYESTLEPPAGVDLNDSDLTVRRKWNDRYRLCCNLVSTGNHKQVYEPRDTILPETTFPEMSRFKSLAWLEANAAHVAFADGQTGEAIVHVEDSIVFGEKISSSILIGRLVGVACSSITFVELDDHWAQLSINDAHELRAFFGARSNGPALLLESIKSEKKATRAALESCVARPGDELGTLRGDDSASGILTAIQKLGAAEAQSTLADAEADTDKYYDSVIAVLNGPETGWLQLKEPAEVSSKAPLSARLAEIVKPSLSQVMVVEVRTRTRIRLAYLTASAIEYRWINGKLPDKIEQFTTKEERLDPSSGKNFVYKRDGSWFRITRESKDALGGVGMTNPPHAPDPDLIPLRP